MIIKEIPSLMTTASMAQSCRQSRTQNTLGDFHLRPFMEHTCGHYRQEGYHLPQLSKEEPPQLSIYGE